LYREGGAVRFSIFDNGRGLEKPVRPDGQGLMGIAERVRLLGGKFDIQSAPGKGTRLTVTIPIPPHPNLHEE
jgi:signal transduction histidine kinase